jgi:hypothetical protein
MSGNGCGWFDRRIFFAVKDAFGFVRAKTEAMAGNAKIINATLNQKIPSCFFDMDVLLLSETRSFAGMLLPLKGTAELQPGI